MRLIISLLFFIQFGFATAGEEPILPDLTFTWIGILVLLVFIVSYYFIAAEELHHLDKAKPSLAGGVLIFILIGIYYTLNYPTIDGKSSIEVTNLQWHLNHLILEISEIFFFLFVAMTYIETMIYMGVFDKLKYNLISKGYSYKKLFWLTGLLAFFISPVADNLTTALILSTVLITIEREKINFLVPGAINIVVAANAGGAWSPFGDITTLMAWTAGKGTFIDFLALFPASIIGYLITAFLLSRFLPEGKPHFDPSKEEKPQMMKGAKVVIGLGIFTIASAVLGRQFLHFPAMWGMMFGLAALKIYSIRIKSIIKKDKKFDIFQMMTKVENNTLFFFFGILAAVGGLYVVGWLNLVAKVYDPSILGPTISNIGVGFLSAVVDNVPVMSAVLKANPEIMQDNASQWMLVTLTAGIGGSLISFGSAAGVGVMGKLRGIYTFGSHIKYAWTILIGYIISIAVWYIQFEVLGFY